MPEFPKNLSGFPNDVNWNTLYDKFLAWSAWFGAGLYGIPAAVLLAVCWYFQVAEKFWIPFLIVYFIGAIAHQLTFGFQALNIQCKVLADETTAELKRSLRALERKS